MRAPLAPVEAWTAARDSRFLARLVSLTERAGMAAVLAERSAAHPGATHHCWALRVWRGEADGLPEVAPAAAFEVQFDYTHTGAVERVAARYSARRRAAAYGAETRLVLSVSAGRADAFAGELLEATGGAVALDRRSDRLEPAGKGPPA